MQGNFRKCKEYLDWDLYRSRIKAMQLFIRQVVKEKVNQQLILDYMDYIERRASYLSVYELKAELKRIEEERKELLK